jgi:hypothetical protein
MGCSTLNPTPIVLTLDEDFVYTLGEGPANQVWTIERQGDVFSIDLRSRNLA